MKKNKILKQINNAEQQKSFNEFFDFLLEEISLEFHRLKEQSNKHKNELVLNIKIAIYSNKLAEILISNGELDIAIKYLNIALKVYQKTPEKNQPKIATILSNLADIHTIQNKLDEAIEYYIQSAKIREEITIYKTLELPKDTTTTLQNSNRLLSKAYIEAHENSSTEPPQKLPKEVNEIFLDQCYREGKKHIGTGELLRALEHFKEGYRTELTIGIDTKSSRFLPLIQATKKIDLTNDNFESISAITAFTIKQIIENRAKLNYLFKDILHVDALLPETLKQFEVPKYSNIFYMAMHFAASSTTAKIILGKEYSNAPISIETVLYGLKLHLNDYISNKEKNIVQDAQYNSINNPLDFVKKCAPIISSQYAKDIVLSNTAKILNPALELSKFNLISNTLMEGIECYKAYQPQTNYQPSITAKTTPYIIDISIVYKAYFYIANQNKHNEHLFNQASQPNIIKTFFVIQQIFGAINLITTTHSISELIISNLEENHLNPIIDYLGSFYNYWISNET